MAVQRTTNNSSNSRKLTGRLLLHNLPLLLLLLTFTTTTTTSGAILPSTSRVNSASSAFTSAGQSSTNQRSERSASALLEDTVGNRGSSGGSGSNSEMTQGELEKRNPGSTNGCSSDFVENFFRLLSGPVGTEAEALVAAVLKLISEKDRVNWPALVATAKATTALQDDVSAEVSPSASPSVSPSFAQTRGPYFPDDRSGLLGQSAMARSQQGSKRGAPKFNPTGWRRKRSVSFLPQAPPRQPFHLVSEAAVQQILRLLASEEQEEQQRQQQHHQNLGGLSPKFFDLGDDDDDGDELQFPPEMPEWRKHIKRDGLETVLLRRRQLKPKRKPLEFNPTGW